MKFQELEQEEKIKISVSQYPKNGQIVRRYYSCERAYNWYQCGNNMQSFFRETIRTQKLRKAKIGPKQLFRYLQNKKIGDQGCLAFSKYKYEVSQLLLSGNQITPLGCRYLAQLCLNNLQTLMLNSNNINSWGCKVLASNQWPFLKYLSLSENQIDDKGCNFLAKSNWPKLYKLRLASNFISGIGCQYLKKSNWKQLAITSLEKNHFKYDYSAQDCEPWLCYWGFKELTKANFKEGLQFFLFENRVGVLAHKYLKAKNWTVRCQGQYDIV